MPDRTKEQLQQIYEDLLAVREVVNQLHERGELWPTPMNGKTWEEEKNEHYFAGINAMTDLIRSGRVESCEVISACESGISNLEHERKQSGFWNHYGKQYYSSDEHVINNGRTSVDEIIDNLKLAVYGRLAESDLIQLEKDIDSFGDTACGPRAMMENSGKSDGLENNLSLPRVDYVNYNFRA